MQCKTCGREISRHRKILSAIAATKLSRRIILLKTKTAETAYETTGTQTSETATVQKQTKLETAEEADTETATKKTSKQKQTKTFKNKRQNARNSLRYKNSKTPEADETFKNNTEDRFQTASD